MDYKYTAKVSKDSWFIKLHCWLWEADPDQIDFCKLFWGYIFAIPNIVLRILFSPFYFTIVRPLIRRADRKSQEESRLSMEEYSLIKEWEAARRKIRQDRANEFLARASQFFSTRPARFLIGAVIIVSLTAGAAWLGYLLFLLIKVIIENALSALIVMISVIAIFAGVGFLIWLGSKLRNTVVAEILIFGLKDGKHTFFGAMRHGYEGVKMNTCPKIELVD